VAWSLTGTDASLFTIDAATGAVTFNASPDYEAPADGGHDNLYDIVVHANDGVNDVTQDVAITVTDVAPVIYGSEDTDTLNGTSENDTIYGLGGDDEVDGGAGIDNLFGGNGNDSFRSTEASTPDHFDGGNGIDGVVVVRTGISTHLSIDMSAGGGGADIGDGTTLASFELSYFILGSGSDTFVGDENTDYLLQFVATELGDDTVSGGGNDYLAGGSGNDAVVYSGAGPTTPSHTMGWNPSGVMARNTSSRILVVAHRTVGMWPGISRASNSPTAPSPSTTS
jgi:Ca2+-binding RTX toxin-like protein